MQDIEIKMEEKALDVSKGSQSITIALIIRDADVSHGRAFSCRAAVEVVIRSWLGFVFRKINQMKTSCATRLSATSACGSWHRVFFFCFKHVSTNRVRNKN